ncbi:hypothetical protein THAR02_07011 [Trichoderma harzianum]|uniref:Uncharacterized protein n=1 Tax=Trichoderma harzianum TaxID=5544 RepID=A0A0F9XKE3_TRIHA|nr:hypothetical protein THAR02_07011 [Trichoderma harzianum]
MQAVQLRALQGINSCRSDKVPGQARLGLVWFDPVWSGFGLAGFDRMGWDGMGWDGMGEEEDTGRIRALAESHTTTKGQRKAEEMQMQMQMQMQEGA